MHRSLVLIISLACCTACVPQADYDYDQSEEASLLYRILGNNTQASIDILALSPDIEELLDSRIESDWSTRQKLKALRELLYGKDELNIQYDAMNTLTALGTFDARSGNCLSMTSLFIAAARYVDLDAHFQTVAVDSTWDREGNTMIRYEHIIATGYYAGGKKYVMDFLPEFVLGDKKTNLISDETALTLHLNNLGAEAILEGRINDAVTNLSHAIELRPQYSDAWNNMGAAMRRTGQYDLAEFSYQRAVYQDAYNYSALSNLAYLYAYQGRGSKAAKYKKRVDKYRSGNPYYLLYQAELSFQEGRHEEARQYLKRAIRLKRDEPDFYLALSDFHEKMGEKEESVKMFEMAEKYRLGILQAPERRMHHRFWTMSVSITPL